MNNSLLTLYFSKKILIIFLMGIASGIPLYMVLSTLFIWLTRENIDISTVGLFALTQIPWTLKFLWAPIVDTFKLPFIHQYLGQRKSWLLLTQFFLIISIISLGFSNPSQNLWITAIFAFLTAFFSATQDIIIDAYRIEILEDEKQGAGAAATQFGYRLGGIIAGAGSLYLKHLFEWSIVFFIIATFIAFLMIIILVVKVDFDRINRSSRIFFSARVYFKEYN